MSKRFGKFIKINSVVSTTIATGGIFTISEATQYRRENIWPGLFSPIVATGGTITTTTINGIQYKIHTFTSTSQTSFTITDPGFTNTGASTFEVITWGGGGGGGGALVGGPGWGPEGAPGGGPEGGRGKPPGAEIFGGGPGGGRGTPGGGGMILEGAAEGTTGIIDSGCVSSVSSFSKTTWAILSFCCLDFSDGSNLNPEPPRNPPHFLRFGANPSET